MFANFERLGLFSVLFGAESGTQHIVGSDSQPSQREAEGIALQELFTTDSSLLLPWQGYQ